MAKYFLRMEGVNLCSFVYDTNNLSTIRGGGLMLLEAPVMVLGELSNSDNLNPSIIGSKNIVSGASIGLMELELPDGDSDEENKAALSIRSKVADYLATAEGVENSTFVVDIQKEEKDFGKTMQKLLAKNRWRQFQQPTIVAPSRNGEIAIKACDLDGIRPGVEPKTIKEKKCHISKSVACRHNFGLEKKQKFYRNELEIFFKEPLIDKFTNNFEELTDDKNRGDLHHKMAVIYIDGNHFGKIRDRKCQSGDDLQEFDLLVKKSRAKALYDLLKRMDTHTSDGYKKDDKYRLETLLWGGDELIWVVPAWTGWDVLQSFYTKSADKEWRFKDEELTHASGMVFCHYNAPIHRIVELCKSLANAVKEEKTENRSKNLFQYLVLESFDHIGQNLEEFRKRHVPFAWEATLNGDTMDDSAELVRELKKRFPRGQIYKAVHAAITTAGEQERASSPDGIDPSMKFMDRLSQILSEDILRDVEKIQNIKYFGENASTWLHLAQLWDFISEKEALL